MRVGIDGYNLAMPFGTGIATYGYMLGRALKSKGVELDGVFGLDAGADDALRETHFFEQLGNADIRPKMVRRVRRRILAKAMIPVARTVPEIALSDLVEKRPLSGNQPAFDRLHSFPFLFELAHRYFKIHGRFLRIRLNDPLDVMHWTYPVPIKLVGSRNIYTLHDLVPLRLPYTTLDQKRAYRKLVMQCANEGAQICTVSQTSASDIVQQLGIAPERVSNCYQASPFPPLSEDNSDVEGARAFLQRGLGLEWQSYFLYFGAIEPKKNIGRLLEAFLSLDTKTKLVIVSSRSWQNDRELGLLEEAAARRPAGDGAVIRISHAPRSMLVKIIRGARGVLFPSLFEGFGLPVLEALQQGVPVLTSAIGSLPEVAGDAAVYVDPYDVGQIREGIQRLDDDPDLRCDLSIAGRQQAARFSIDAFGERLLAMYASVASRESLTA